MAAAWNAAFVCEGAPFKGRLGEFCRAHGIPAPPARTAYNWCDGEACPPSSATFAAFRWMAREQPREAFRFLSRAAALEEAGVVLALAPRHVAPREVAVEALRLGRDVGELQELTAEAAADGIIDDQEARLIARAAEPVAFRAGAIQAAARAVPTPQLSLASL